MSNARVPFKPLCTAIGLGSIRRAGVVSKRPLRSDASRRSLELGRTIGPEPSHYWLHGVTLVQGVHNVVSSLPVHRERPKESGLLVVEVQRVSGRPCGFRPLLHFYVIRMDQSSKKLICMIGAIQRGEASFASSRGGLGRFAYFATATTRHLG